MISLAYKKAADASVVFATICLIDLDYGSRTLGLRI